jgi:UDP-N-acetyl-D-glucosamine dehydrogenase
LSTPAPQVGIIGLGYVGLPLATAFAEAGVHVLGLDAIQSKVDQINSGRSYIEDVASERLEPLTSAGLIRATTNWDEIREVEAVLIALPTPLDEQDRKSVV